MVETFGFDSNNKFDSTLDRNKQRQMRKYATLKKLVELQVQKKEEN